MNRQREGAAHEKSLSHRRRRFRLRGWFRHARLRRRIPDSMLHYYDNGRRYQYDDPYYIDYDQPVYYPSGKPYIVDGKPYYIDHTVTNHHGAVVYHLRPARDDSA